MKSAVSFLSLILPFSAILACEAANYAPVKVAADACDDVKEGYDKETVKYRAIDIASLAAIKTSGVIQRVNEKMLPATMDVVAYRIIDEYFVNVNHEVTYNDGKRVCVHVTGEVDITDENLKEIIAEHRNNMFPDQVVETAEAVKEKMTLKPQKLEDKKLIYVADMKYWNGDENNYYTDYVKELFGNSEYFYVSDNADVADYIVTPHLKKAEVDELDAENHKMQMLVMIVVDGQGDGDISSMSESQNHFILFSTDKDEQEIADTLLRKLLARASKAVSDKLDSQIAHKLESQKVRNNK